LYNNFFCIHIYFNAETDAGVVKGDAMGTKKSVPLEKHITIRVTEKEYDKVAEYCADNDMNNSEYIRSLIRIHLGMADDFKKMYYVEPRFKK